VQLSAGQCQLLALTRALVWEPKVLLLDETTEAIDHASEAQLRAAIRQDRVSGERAVVTVVHRLATAREADRVIVLEAGCIVETGSPDELIRRHGRFAALVEIEAAGWDWRNSDSLSIATRPHGPPPARTHPWRAPILRALDPPAMQIRITSAPQLHMMCDPEREFFSLPDR
jgi:ABC-type multidrug transport system ATPase subunit